MKRIVPAFVVLLVTSIASARTCDIWDMVKHKDGLLLVRQRIEKTPTFVRRYGNFGRTALDIAATFGKYDIAKLLIDAGADVNAVSKSRSGHSPLLQAAYSKTARLRLVQLLVENGADVNYLTPTKECAIQVAVKRNKLEVARYLLANGADPLLGNRYQSALIEAFRNHQHLCLEEVLKNLAQKKEYSVMKAALSGSVEDMEALLNSDRSLREWRGPQKLTLLHIAAFGGNIEVVKRLLPLIPHAMGCADGFAPIHLGAMSGRNEVITLLIEAGTNVDAPSRSGRTPLIMAARNNHVTTVEHLVHYGVGIDQLEGQELRSALHAATKAGAHDAMRALIELGANVDIEGGFLETPLHVAAVRGDTDAIRILIDAGTNVNARSWKNQTPCRLAQLYGNSVAASLISKAGGKASIETTHKETPSALRRLLGAKEKALAEPVMSRSKLETVNTIERNERAIIIVPIAEPSEEIIIALAEKLRQVLKMKVLIEKEGLSKTYLDEAGLFDPSLREPRVAHEIMKLVRQHRKNIAIVCVTEADTIASNDTRFLTGYWGVFVESCHGLGGKHHHLVPERLFKKALARSTVALGMEPCRKNIKTCPRAFTTKARMLDSFDLNMCDTCREGFKKRFGHDSGWLEEGAPEGAVDEEEVF